jgi:hypothetical protein
MLQDPGAAQTRAAPMLLTEQLYKSIKWKQQLSCHSQSRAATLAVQQ